MLTYALEAKMKLKATVRILIIYLILFLFLSSAIMAAELARNVNILRTSEFLFLHVWLYVKIYGFNFTCGEDQPNT